MRTLVTALFLLVALPSAAERQQRLELVRESLTTTHCRYRELIGSVETDTWITLPCAAETPRVRELRVEPPLRFVNGRLARRLIVEERPLEPYATDIDMESGAVLRRVPLFFHGKPAAVFDPNPVASLNAPALEDQNDSPQAIPPGAYKSVELDNAAAEGPLRGPWAAMVDRQEPSVAPPDAAASLLFDRGQPGFEDVNAFFHIDLSQRHVQSLGYTGSRLIAPYPIEVDAHSLNGADNSVFLPSITNYGVGTLHFGEGGTDDAEDADIVIHEYGHALLEWISPGTFGGFFASESRAMAEGFCDYWAYSTHRAARAASGRDLFCLADWDARCWQDEASERCAYPAGSDCLRRMDGARTMADFVDRDVSGTEHVNGSIWSSALREIHETLIAMHGAEEGRRIANTFVLESAFGAPPRPTFAVMAHRLIEADHLLYNGMHGATICAAMIARGILASCDVRPRGELTLFQSTDRGLAIPELDSAGITSTVVVTDTRTIERLLVRVDISHSARGDLRIELIAPDGATVLLQQVSNERDEGVHVTFGLDAAPVQPLEIFRGRSAAGTWRLRVQDLRPRDQGALLSWALMIQFAGQLPLTLRPRSTRTAMIPVVARTHGANDTEFRSDVRIANPEQEPRNATLIFTPSGQDGWTSFSAIDIALPAGHTVSIDDVVASAFQTLGSGSLEVLDGAVVMSRTYHRDENGTIGEGIPIVAETTALGERAIYFSGLRLPGFRYNVGVTETVGAGGTVRLETAEGIRELAILPFSHLQLNGLSAEVKVSVIGGSARVGAYLSQIDAGNGDSLFIPARRLAPRIGVAPAASATGLDGTHWSSDLWSGFFELTIPFVPDIRYLTNDEVVPLPLIDDILRDVVATSFARPGTVGAIVSNLPAFFFSHTRVTTGATSQYVPFIAPEGPSRQHVLFIENSGVWRTNIGFVTLEETLAEVTVHQPDGTVLERRLLGTKKGLAQLSVGVPVTGGRAEVRFLTGEGRAYASVIDTRTKDATLVIAR